MRNWILVLFVGLFASSVGGASETVEGAKKDYATFKQQMAVKLDAMEKNIAELKAQAKTKGGAAQDKVIAEAESARETLKKKMQTLSEDSKESWRTFKEDLVETADALNAKLKKALQ